MSNHCLSTRQEGHVLMAYSTDTNQEDVGHCQISVECIVASYMGDLQANILLSENHPSIIVICEIIYWMKDNDAEM